MKLKKQSLLAMTIRKENIKNIEPVAGLPGDNNQTPFGPQFVLILSLIVGLSLLAAFISLWIYKGNVQTG